MIENNGDDMPSSPKLFSFEFIALCLIIVAAFCNVSVFYSFYHYLGEIGIPVVWRGFLVGLEPMAAFVLRLFVLPWLHVRNASAVMTVSLVLLIFVSCAYLWATTVPMLVVLRILHGAAFVLLTSAAVALVVNFIPREKSGQGFSVVSVATMIPYAVIPPLSEALLPYLRNEANIYAGVSVFAGIAILLLVALRGRIGQALQGMDGTLMRRPTLPELRENLRLRAVILLLSMSLLIYLAHAACFYFLKDLSLQIGGGEVGLFFTISMVTMISVRAVGGRMFDRINKKRLLQGGLVLLVLCFALIPHAALPMPYYILAVFYGFGMGMVLPLVNALLFSASPPLLRGLNTNLTLFTLDMAYFLMPYLGGILITLGVGFAVLFYAGAGFLALSLALIMMSEQRRNQRAGAPAPGE